MRIASRRLAAFLLIVAWHDSVLAQQAGAAQPAVQTMPGASNPGNAAPASPYPGDSVAFAQFDNVLTNDCGKTADTGHQLSLSWQQQIQASAATNFVQSLVDFRQNAAMCLEHIGDLLNADAPYAGDLTSSISGSWLFSTDLWMSTNQFAAALTVTPTPPASQLIAAALPQSQKFSAAVDQFAKWIADTKAHIAALQHPSSSG
jgi:hypothetical protein